MIFSCGETVEALSAWHKFFVLWPRTVGEENGRVRCAWLQMVERRGKYYSGYAEYFWLWEYRLIEAER